MPSPDDAAQRAVLIVEQPDLGTLRITGPDGRSWLNGILTCDVLDIAAGTARYGLLLTKPGKIVTDVHLVADDATLYCSAAPGTVAELHQMLDHFLIMEDAEIEERSGDFSWIFLHGPLSVEAATRAAALAAVAWGALDRTGLGGAVCLVRREGLRDVLGALLKTKGAVRAAPEDWERIRIERAVPAYGVDFGRHLNPHEASLERRAVSWSKGCYLGQEAVCMQEMRGKVKRRLVPLRLEGPSPPERGAPVADPASGETVGEITSATFSAQAGAPVALALVKSPHVDPGARLTVGGQPAAIVAPPVRD